MLGLSRLFVAISLVYVGACGDNTIDARDIAVDECQDACLIKNALRCSGGDFRVIDCQNACYDVLETPQECAYEVAELWRCRTMAHYYCHRTGPNTTEATWGETCFDYEKALTFCEGLTDAP